MSPSDQIHDHLFGRHAQQPVAACQMCGIEARIVTLTEQTAAVAGRLKTLEAERNGYAQADAAHLRERDEARAELVRVEAVRVDMTAQHNAALAEWGAELKQARGMADEQKAAADGLAARELVLLAALQQVEEIACRSAGSVGFGEEPPEPANRDGEELAMIARGALAGTTSLAEHDARVTDGLRAEHAAKLAAVEVWHGNGRNWLDKQLAETWRAALAAAAKFILEHPMTGERVAERYAACVEAIPLPTK